MRVVIVAAGDLAAADARRLDGADLVIAADGGTNALDRLGRRPDLVVGDLDSADPATVERMAGAGTRVERHPVDKDASDTELALDAAVAAGATEVVLLGALGGGNMRDPENGVITLHTGIRGDADAPIAWNFDPSLVARVTITPVGVAP